MQQTHWLNIFRDEIFIFRSEKLIERGGLCGV